MHIEILMCMDVDLYRPQPEPLVRVRTALRSVKANKVLILSRLSGRSVPLRIDLPTMHEQDPSNVSTSSSMICLYITTLGFGLPTELVTLPIVAVLLWLQHERCLVFVILLLVVGSIRLLSGIPVILSRWESKSLEKRATQDPNDVRLGPLDRHERCLVWFNLGLIGSIAGLVGLFYWEDLVVRLVITGLIGATWLGLIGGLGIWAWTLHQLFD